MTEGFYSGHSPKIQTNVETCKPLIPPVWLRQTTPLWQGSLWGAATKPPWPLWGCLGLPRRGDSAGKACGTSYLFPLHYSLKTFPFPHGFVLWWSANCESLSHGYAVPAPFSKGAFGVQRRSPPGHCGGASAPPRRGDSPGWQVSTWVCTFKKYLL